MADSVSITILSEHGSSVVQAQECFQKPNIWEVHHRLTAPILIDVATDSAEYLHAVSEVRVAGLIVPSYELQADEQHASRQCHACLLSIIVEEESRLKVTYRFVIMTEHESFVGLLARAALGFVGTA